MTEQRPINSRRAGNPTLVKLTVADYVLLNDAGAFPQGSKTELVDGSIYFVNSQYRPHARAKAWLLDEIGRTLKPLFPELVMFTESSVEIQPASMPQPDIYVLEDDGGNGPTPSESVRLVVEISESTLAFDLKKKARIYAKGGLPEYWVVDLRGRRLVRMTGATMAGYAATAEFAFGQPVASLILPGLVVQTDGLA